MANVVVGRVDLAGRLIAADLPLLRLQEQAGASLGQPLAIAPLAGIVRLARTHRILISRDVTCSDGDQDLELIVRAQPDDDGVGLIIAGWSARPLRRLQVPDELVSGKIRLPMAHADDRFDFQIVEQPDFRLEAEDIDLADLVRSAARLMKVRAAARRVCIDGLPDGGVLRARGDHRRVLQILVKVIGNAIRYSPKDATIWIRAEKDAETVIVIIADEGSGIALADQARIFDNLMHVDPSEPAGSELGLFISRRLAQAMGGNLIVDSAPGKGARFALMLPAV